MKTMVFVACLVLLVAVVVGDSVQNLTTSSNNFSQSLYQKIVPVGQASVCYSPFSLHLALSMTLLGARKETATEMAQTLGLTNFKNDSAHQTYKTLIDQINNATNVRLYTANAAFVNPTRTVEPQYVKEVNTFYNATASNFDFSAIGGPEKVINDFVKEKTDGKISDILPPNTIDAQTLMILINTLFFNGTWEKQFQSANTRPMDFRKLDSTTVKVDMMSDDRTINIKRNVDGVDIAELPFRGRRFSLFIALPQRVNGLTDFERSLTTFGKLESLFEGLLPRRVSIIIPKFKVESQFSLSKALKELGMARAFNERLANFEGINRNGSVYINEVFHKAMIEVKETGTVAAAATAVIVSVRLTSINRPPVETFTADHPFVFFLRDNESRDILFQGRFVGS